MSGVRSQLMLYFLSLLPQRAFNALCHSTHLYGRRLVLEWADSEVTLQALRRKTAEHFHGKTGGDAKRTALDRTGQRGRLSRPVRGALVPLWTHQWPSRAFGFWSGLGVGRRLPPPA